MVTPSNPFGIFRKIEAGVARAPSLLSLRSLPLLRRATLQGLSEGRARCDGKARPTIPGIREALYAISSSTSWSYRSSTLGLMRPVLAAHRR